MDSFNKSFLPKADVGEYTEVFSKMIEETWWEILGFGAKINLFLDKKKKQIEITDPLRSILESKNKVNGYFVYTQDNIPVEHEGNTYRIKHLRLTVNPKPIDEEFREIWVQRKRMKIGNISKGLQIHHKIAKQLSGYVVLDRKP